MNSFEQADRFLRLLYPSDSITFQTFPNSANCNARPEILHGTIEQHWNRLKQKNDRGAGVYAMVNTGDGEGRKNNNVNSIVRP
jgi:hypothetical protein